MKIRILGTGCAKCKAMEKGIREAARDLGLDLEVEKVTDAMEIVSQGVLVTPALMVGGKIRAVGKVPARADMVHWLQSEKGGENG